VAELIVLLDEAGNQIGSADKLASHHAETPLHLAFSCYVFNSSGQFLITQRAHSKKVWPGVWTNSVCGHPAPGEQIVDAIERRLDYELGMKATEFTALLPDYRYKTPPFKGIIENEVCPVYIARSLTDPNPNGEEVEAYKWLDWNNYVYELNNDKTDVYSWWCKDQLKQLVNNPLIEQYSKTTS
jgi:isopentenyl-diphosphate Delta-isomerase